MTGWLRLLAVVYWTGLIFWIGAIFATGVAAFGTFGTLSDEALVLERFSAYPAAHHGRLAAGLAMEQIFALTDLVQFGAAVMVIFGLIGQALLMRRSMLGVGHVVRTLAIVVAVTLLVYQALAITPQMNRDLLRYRDAAASGQLEAAAMHRSSFESLHPTAERLSGLRFGALLIAAMASAASLSAGGVTRSAGRTIEPPALLQSKR